MNSWALSKQFLLCFGQRHQPEKSLISVKEFANIVESPSRVSSILAGRTLFIQMISTTPLSGFSGQSKQESHTARYTVYDGQMGSIDGIMPEANLCVILRARSFSGMVSQSTSMSRSEQKTIFGIRASSSAEHRKSQL